MNTLFWLALLALAATLVWLVWYARRQAQERERDEAARIATFVSGLTPAAKPADPAAAPAAAAPVPHGDVAQQRLLFEAAHKAGEANEPALAIQLYARLLSRYPTTSFAEPARAAAAALKKKLVKG